MCLCATPSHAPVLLIPRLFEPKLCRELMDFWEAGDKRRDEVTQGRGTEVRDNVVSDVKKRADVIVPDGSVAEVFADLGWALLLGGFGGFGVYFLTLAYRRTSASLLAPFEYFGVLSALVIGWMVFSEWPVQRIFPGVVFIVGAGLVIIVRERGALGKPKQSS